MAWASTPPCSPRSGCFLVSRKTPTSCRLFLGAEAGEAKVHQPPLVLIGDILSPGGSEVWQLYGKRRHRVGFSLAGLRRLVLIGDILSPGGSRCWREGGRRQHAADLVASGFYFLALIVDSCGTKHQEARGASRGNAFQGSKRGFPQLALRASKRGTFLPVAAKPHRQTVRCRRSFKLCDARARGCPCPRASCGTSEARQANRSERAVNGGQGRPM